MMSKIKGKDTRPELVVRRALHRLGYRYRLHRKDLPGRPDMIFPSCKAVIFVNGCFWHAHDCGLFRLPRSEEHTSELQSRPHLVCRLLLETKKAYPVCRLL